MTMSIDTRLEQLGLILPAAPQPVGNYVGGVQTGNLLFMSGCGPRLADNSSITGKVGQDLSVEQGYDAARLVGMNMLANVKAQLGSLDRVERLVKVLGMVNCPPDFKDMPKVINGFSDLMVEVFGDDVGKGARSAVGMAALPFQIAVEVEAIFQVRSE
jgi:enamine deaminase RidA (YjgF/YER057c/UK114 family)